mmetsp:Transcript_97151/g.278032  ORF Transcript_97151/g.278032 Transcript_97151/m.278032 type:complete len:247 (+) Transcript_97151:717-1457(+)
MALEGVDHVRERTSAHIVHHDVERALDPAHHLGPLRTAGPPPEHFVCPHRSQVPSFVAPAYRRHLRAPSFRQLHGRQSNAPRRAGHEHAVAGLDAGEVQHVLRRAVGAWDAGEFDVTPVRLDPEHLARGYLHELGKGAVNVRGHPLGLVIFESVDSHAAPDDHAVALFQRGLAAVEHRATVDPIPERGHEPAAVGALNERERRRSVVPANLTGRLRVVGKAEILRKGVRVGTFTSGVRQLARGNLG